MRVRQCRDGTGLALKPLAGGWVVGQVGREHLERDGAVQARISRTIDLAHATRAGGADDLVGAEPRALQKSVSIHAFVCPDPTLMARCLPSGAGTAHIG